MLPILLFVVLFMLLLIGFPVAFTLGGVAMVFSFFTDSGIGCFALLPQRIWGIMDNYLLLAVPLFVYMGVMLEKSGIAESLLETMALLFGRVRGGLAVSVVIVGALLAASTGIVGATVVTMGLLSLPTMLKRGYRADLACGTIAASGTLGQIIPPSIVLILLASVLNVPVGDMFMAAVIPGLVLVGLYLVWVMGIAFLKPAAAPAMPQAELDVFRGWQMVRQLASAFLPPLALIIAVLGSIFAGIASPTEAAAVGAMGATILTLLHRRLTYGTLEAVMRETTHLTCMVFLILVGASAFGLVFRELHGDRLMADLIQQANLGPRGFLVVVLIVIFIAGFFIDFIEITFIIVPVVAPIFQQMGIDLVWLGILIALNLQTSFLTPPFGFSLFYLKGVAPPEVKTGDVYRGILPYIVIQGIVLGLVLALPESALWLPGVLDK